MDSDCTELEQPGDRIEYCTNDAISDYNTRQQSSATTPTYPIDPYSTGRGHGVGDNHR